MDRAKRNQITDEEIIKALSENPMRITDACVHFKIGRYVMTDRMNTLARKGLLKVKVDRNDMRAKVYGVW